MNSHNVTAFRGNDIEASIDFVLHGQPALHTSEIGKLSLPANCNEALRCREIAAMLEGYARRTVSLPMSIAVFGPPGSGKSFCVEQISRQAGCGAPVVINVSQLSTPQGLVGAIERFLSSGTKSNESASAAGEPAQDEKTSPTRVFFFDEFDASLDGESLGWLRWFLAPMQDGVFYKGDVRIEVGKAVFIFAGGTAVSLGEFEKRALENPKEYREKKVPDFISRLRGFIDIEGINGIEDERATRRALVLRHLLKSRWPNVAVDNKVGFPISR